MSVAKGTEEPRGSHHVQSLARGLSVIRAFDADHPVQTLTEVAKTTGLTRAAARRFLLTLVDLGYMTSQGRLFALTPRVLELGYAYLAGQTLPEVAQPHLERLVAQIKESSSVAVLDDQDVVYVARVATSRIMAVTITVGTRLPAHCTSMGRVLLSGLNDDALGERLAGGSFETYTSRTVTDPKALVARIQAVREQGFALVDQELEEGLRSIAVPICDRAGRVAAAVNVSANSTRTSTEEMTAILLPPLRQAAKAIQADMDLITRQAAR